MAMYKILAQNKGWSQMCHRLCFSTETHKSWPTGKNILKSMYGSKFCGSLPPSRGTHATSQTYS